MKDALPQFLSEHKAAIIEEWRANLKEKFGRLEEDSRIWLAQELEELYDDIAGKLDTASAGDPGEAIASELFDSLEFASRIECLVSGMRCIVRFVRELCRESNGLSEEESEELVTRLEASLRLQLHEEVQDFCRRWAGKAAVEENPGPGDAE